MWIRLNDKEYDVSGFISHHPGGRDILQSYVGMDATDVFKEFHSGQVAWKLLKTLPSRSLVDDVDHVVVPEFVQEIRKLREEVEIEGLFRPNKVYYARKLSELGALFCLSTWLLYCNMLYGAAFVMGLFFQQSGWLSHDFAHNQVVDRNKREPFVNLIGNLFQGFAGAWWIPKHMMHHAHPNALHEDTNQPMDEDFDTAPLLIWTKRLLPKPDTTVGQMVRLFSPWQGIYLWLVIPWSKMYWDYASLRVVIDTGAWREFIMISSHYILSVIYAMCLCNSFMQALWFILLSRLWGGFLISWVFIQSHNGMVYYDRGTLGYYEAQVRTTRNMALDALTTWFTGGLNYQIEHHLFPRMPRHNLSCVSRRVELICQKHGLPYTTRGIISSSLWLTCYLESIGMSSNKQQ